MKKVNDLFKKHQAILKLFLCVTVIIMMMFLPYIITDMPLTYGTDIKTQWYEFYTEFQRLITAFFTNGTLPFYSWDTFLGANFWASRSYYLIGDIYEYLSLLLNSNFFSLYMIMTIIKIYVAAFTMYYLLQTFQFKPNTRIIGALCYAFSGWAIFYSGQLSFFSFYSFVPLYFAGIENYLRDKRRLLFIFAAALLLFTNFYLFYTLSFFTPIYYIYRYRLLKPHFRHFIKDTLVLIGYYLIAVMMTGVLTLPTIYYLLDNSRFGQASHLLTYPYVKLYLHELVSMLVPNYLYIYQNNVFEIDWHVVREICMYAGSLTAVTLPQFLFDKDRRYRNATIMIYLVMIMIMISPAANSAIHGFADPSLRWLFLLIIVNIVNAARYIDRIDTANPQILIITAFGLAILCAVIIPVSAQVTEGSYLLAFDTYRPQLLLFVCFALLYLAHALNFSKMSGHINKIMLMLTVLELGISGLTLSLICLQKNRSYTWEFINEASTLLESKDGDFMAYLNGLDDNNTGLYYRVYVDFYSIYWEFSLNMSQIYAIPGVMTYDSLFSPSFNDTFSLAPDVSYSGSTWAFDIQNDDLLDFLNVKYLIVNDEDELPENGNYSYIDSYCGLLVYENNDYRSLATTYSDLITNTEFSTGDYTLKDLESLLVVEATDYDAISAYLQSTERATLTDVSYYENQLHGYINTDAESFAVLTLPYDAGWQVLVNGTKVTTYQVNGGYIGIPLEAGSNSIDMYFVPQGFRYGLFLSIGGLAIFGIIIIYDVRKGQRNEPQRNNKKPNKCR